MTDFLPKFRKISGNRSKSKIYPVESVSYTLLKSNLYTIKVLVKVFDSLLVLKVHALRCGYRLLDTAHIYGSEEIVGAAIHEAIEENIIKSRSEVFVTTKLFGTFHKPNLILGAIRFGFKFLIDSQLLFLS